MPQKATTAQMCRPLHLRLPHLYPQCRYLARRAPCHHSLAPATPPPSWCTGAKSAPPSARKGSPRTSSASSICARSPASFALSCLIPHGSTDAGRHPRHRDAHRPDRADSVSPNLGRPPFRRRAFSNRAVAEVIGVNEKTVRRKTAANAAPEAENINDDNEVDDESAANAAPADRVEEMPPSLEPAIEAMPTFVGTVQITKANEPPEPALVVEPAGLGGAALQQRRPLRPSRAFLPSCRLPWRRCRRTVELA
jgi:hypothetical protein